MHRENAVKICDVIPRILAPNGRAPVLGTGGYWFESSISDCLSRQLWRARVKAPAVANARHYCGVEQW